MTSDFQVGRYQVGRAPSDFTKQAYVVKYLIRVGTVPNNSYRFCADLHLDGHVQGRADIHKY